MDTTIISLYTEANREYLQALQEADHEKIMQKLAQLKELSDRLVETIGNRDEARRIAYQCYLTALNERNKLLE